MNSNNWGYKEFIADIEHTFNAVFAIYGFSLTTKTDNVSYAEFRSEKIGLYFNYDTSKELQLVFRKYDSNYEYQEFKIEECCILKGVVYKVPICEFKDRACIQSGLAYIKSIIELNFKSELKGLFKYEMDYQLLAEEKYYLNKRIAFLPLEDELKKRIKNIYLPNAGINEMRKRLIDTNEYPEKFKSIHDKYLRN